MNIAFITTVYNEEQTIDDFLDSLFGQSKMPNEIIIVDGGSTDNTCRNIKNFKVRIKKYKGRFILLTKKGNQSVGRNQAIRHARGEIIACSDAGCILDKDWLQNITEPFKNKNVDVVAGYYKGIAKSVFQKCLIPYALVMPDKVNAENFLPATRSVAFTKSIWKLAGGFDQRLSQGEDFAFAHVLKKIQANIVFEKDAIVFWEPRKTFQDAFLMMYLYAQGDAQSSMFRPKVILLFLRYLVGILLLVLFLIGKSHFLFILLSSIFILYLVWAVFKNYRYVKEWPALFILPILQLTADVAVIGGTLYGILKRNIRYN